MAHCSAAKLCHFVSHGGQIILPNELAEVVLADWTGSVPPMPSAGQSLFLTANHGAGSNHTGSNWDSAKSSPASEMSRYTSRALTADLKIVDTCIFQQYRCSAHPGATYFAVHQAQWCSFLFFGTAHSTVWKRSVAHWNSV